VSLRQAAGAARDADGGRGETEAEGISFRWWLRERLLTLAGGAGCSSSSEQSQLEQRETMAAGAARDAGTGCDSCFAAGAARGRVFWSSAGRMVRSRVQPQEVAAGAARVARRERCVQQRLCCRGCRARWMELKQREMQAELRGQPQAEAAGVAQAGSGCRVQQQHRSVAAGAACDKRPLEQRGTRAEAAGSASGGGSGCCSSRSLWALRAAAALLPREQCETDGAGAAQNAGRVCETSLRLRLQEQVDLHRLVLWVVCSSRSNQLLQE
jgi:hypothetical protein